ncbi:MAG: class I SAM-dependent methyltransferase [Acetobacteraceae bacterium]
MVPHLVHLAMRHPALVQYRREVVGLAEGRVLEIGIGSGLNLPLYGGAVRSIVGLEPSATLLRMARTRAVEAAAPIQLIGASAEAMPLDSASFDSVITTWTLCTIPDVSAALKEVRRVLKPGGVLLFVEHGRAPERAVARWQDRLDPLWRRAAGGCHLNRKIDALIESSGLHIDTLTNPRLRGPRTHTFLYLGRARPA